MDRGVIDDKNNLAIHLLTEIEQLTSHHTRFMYVRGMANSPV